MKFQFLKYPFFACLLALAACNSDGTKDIEAFYFPIKELREGKVYEFRSTGEEDLAPEYRFLKSFEKEGGQRFVTVVYTPAFQAEQLLQEEKASDGMLLEKLLLFVPDSMGRSEEVTVNIEAGNVFPFKVKPPHDGVLLTSLNWQFPQDSSHISWVRNRQFDGDTTFVFQGKKLPAVKFLTLEQVDHETQGTLELPENPGLEIYAKGVGLVWYSKKIGTLTVQYELNQIYSLPDFEEKFKTQLLLPDGLGR